MLIITFVTHWLAFVRRVSDIIHISYSTKTFRGCSHDLNQLKFGQTLIPLSSL